jgi:hypothetical protein
LSTINCRSYHAVQLGGIRWLLTFESPGVEAGDDPAGVDALSWLFGLLFTGLLMRDWSRGLSNKSGILGWHGVLVTRLQNRASMLLWQHSKLSVLLRAVRLLVINRGK